MLENLNFNVKAGSFLTIVGQSGGGKTTLVKIMLGLIEPTSGEVRIDGVRLQTIGLRAYRDQVAAVMQEDQLLSGSISDNICFFDPQFDDEKMLSCAQPAGVHNEIMAMPMAYNSLIGRYGKFAIRWTKAADLACQGALQESENSISGRGDSPS